MSWAAYKRRRDRRRLRIFEAVPDGTVDEAYEWTPSITGGLAPFTIENVGPDLPDGLSITDDTISGTPTEAGEFELILKVTDADGDNVEQGVTMVIVEA
jgi:hypothetical protein